MPDLSPSLGQPLGLLALLALPLIVWLHRHVLQARRREVSSLLLWSATERIHHEGKQRRKVPDRLVLLLELLAAVALALLIAGFDLRAGTRLQPRIGLVVDASASMAGGRPGARPFDEVRAALAREARAQDALRVTLVMAGEQPELQGARDLTAAQADALLAGYAPRASAARINAALELMDGLGVPPDATWLFSDDPELDHPRLVRVGTKAPNVAIVHAGWAPGETPFAAVHNFGPEPVRVQLAAVIDGGRARAAHTLTLASGDEQPVSLPVDANAQQIELRLPEDALAIDDRALLLRPLDRQVPVHATGLSPKLARAYDRALAAIPLLHAAGGPEGAALHVRENAPAPSAVASLLFVTAAPNGAPAELARDLQHDPFAPLLASFDPRGLLWYGFPAAAPADARVLLRGDEPLIWTRANEVGLNVDLDRSNLLSHAAFPLLLGALADQLDRQQGGVPRSNFRIGERVRFARAPGWTGTVEVRTPEGRTLRFEPGADIDLGVLMEPGAYALSTGPERITFAAHFASHSESDISRRAPKRSPPALRIEDQRRAHGPTPMRPALLLLLLACLALAFTLLDRGRVR